MDRSWLRVVREKTTPSTGTVCRRSVLLIILNFQGRAAATQVGPVLQGRVLFHSLPARCNHVLRYLEQLLLSYPSRSHLVRETCGHAEEGRGADRGISAAECPLQPWRAHAVALPDAGAIDCQLSVIRDALTSARVQHCRRQFSRRLKTDLPSCMLVT